MAKDRGIRRRGWDQAWVTENKQTPQGIKMQKDILTHVQVKN